MLLYEGSRAAGGQKSQWNGVIVRDLKLCVLADDWRILAQNHNEWRCLIRKRVRVINTEQNRRRINAKMSGSNGEWRQMMRQHFNVTILAVFLQQ